jgi:hypothetical protein
VKKVLFVAFLAAAVLVPAASASKARRVNLALVALPKSALGAAAHSLGLAHDSGVVSNADAANNAVAATTGSIKALGRVTGYLLDYGDVYSGKAGITAVETSVDRYKTAGAAQRAVVFWKLNDSLLGPLGKSSSVSVQTQPVKLQKLGSTRFGVAATISVVGRSPLTIVDAQASDGQYIVEAQAVSGSAAAARSLASKLLQRLDQRLHLALAGRLHAKAVKLPPKLKAGPPTGGPDLAAAGLTTTDLGTATITDQGYDVDKQALSAYALFMQPAGHFDDLSQEIEWYASANDASFIAAFQGAVFTNTLVAILGSGTTQTPVDVSSVGDSAQATIVASAPSTGSPVYLAVVILTRGQATDLVFTQSQSPIQSADVTSLAQAAATHLNAVVTG